MKKKKILRKSVPDNYWQTGYLFNFLCIPIYLGPAKRDKITLYTYYIFIRKCIICV